MDHASAVPVLVDQIKALYLEEDLPWIIGYSGGKDSTAVLQLVWTALADIPVEKRTKLVHVISTDTLVENPIVATWVSASLQRIRDRARHQCLPIKAHRLVPSVENRFWVNLIGRGYPAPRPMFRWCTSRLKISASTTFIRDVASEHGEAILFLGTRSAESASRRKVMDAYRGSTRDLLHRNSDPKLDRVWVFPPIESWTSDEVWQYLIETENPWGHSNEELFHLYRGATADAECPLVVDTSTPSCGDSRFGCFVCTLVENDKSMSAMILNDADKKWMQPLADFRNNKLRIKGDEVHRDFRRMDGRLTRQQTKDGAKLVHGPYTQQYREELLRALLEAQIEVRKNAPASLKEFELISLEELEAIRQIWVNDKHEIEDSVPVIYQDVMGVAYPLGTGDDGQLFSRDDIALLRKLSADLADPTDVQFRLLREMLHVEQSYKNATRRVGIYDRLQDALKRHAFENEQEALDFENERAAKLGPIEFKLTDSAIGEYLVDQETPPEPLA